MLVQYSIFLVWGEQTEHDTASELHQVAWLYNSLQKLNIDATFAFLFLYMEHFSTTA